MAMVNFFMRGVASEPRLVLRVVISVPLSFSKPISAMRPCSVILALASLACLAACSSPDSRISSHREAFDHYPPEVQQKIRAGQVAVGYSPEMVLLALGEPDRKFTRKTENGDSEVWGYHDRAPRFGFGFGFGSFGRRSATSMGLGVSSGASDPEEKTRIEFRDGQVAAIDSLVK